MLKFVALLVLCYGIVDVYSTYMKVFERCPPEMQKMMRNLREMCLEETGVSESILEDADKAQFDSEGMFATYLKCTYRALGILDDDNVFDQEAFTAVTPNFMLQYVHDLMDKCPPITDTTEEGLSKQFLIFYKCAYELDPNLCFFP